MMGSIWRTAESHNSKRHDKNLNQRGGSTFGERQHCKHACVNVRPKVGHPWSSFWSVCQILAELECFILSSAPRGDARP